MQLEIMGTQRSDGKKTLPFVDPDGLQKLVSGIDSSKFQAFVFVLSSKFTGNITVRVSYKKDFSYMKSPA